MLPDSFSIMIDIVKPNGNENDFIDMARKLGYDAICFAYEKPRAEKYEFEVFTAATGKGRADIRVAYTDQANENIINSRPDIIYGLENGKRHDMIHQRNSGINHVHMRLCASKGVAIGFFLESLQDKRTRQRAMGRMSQNIRLCQKYNVQMVIGSMASDPYQMKGPEDITSFFRTLGMRKPSMDALQEAIGNSLKRRSPEYITEGAEYV